MGLDGGGEEAGEAVRLRGLDVGRPHLGPLVAEEDVALVELHRAGQLLRPELRALEPELRVRIGRHGEGGRVRASPGAAAAARRASPAAAAVGRIWKGRPCGYGDVRAAKGGRAVEMEIASGAWGKWRAFFFFSLGVFIARDVLARGERVIPRIGSHLSVTFCV